MNIHIGSFKTRGKRFGIVVSRFNEFITNRLLESAVTTLKQAGVSESAIEVVWVPGALEVPYFCMKLFRSKKVHGIIALSCVIRGETYHFESVANEVTRGISQVSLEQQVPIATAVLTVDNLEQAIDRAGLKAGNKGAHAALACLEMVGLEDQLK